MESRHDLSMVGVQDVGSGVRPDLPGHLRSRIPRLLRGDPFGRNSVAGHVVSKRAQAFLAASLASQPAKRLDPYPPAEAPRGNPTALLPMAGGDTNGSMSPYLFRPDPRRGSPGAAAPGSEWLVKINYAEGLPWLEGTSYSPDAGFWVRASEGAVAFQRATSHISYGRTLCVAAMSGRSP
jgi:hypothetical protein